MEFLTQSEFDVLMGHINAMNTLLNAKANRVKEQDQELDRMHNKLFEAGLIK